MVNLFIYLFSWFLPEKLDLTNPIPSNPAEAHSAFQSRLEGILQRLKNDDIPITSPTSPLLQRNSFSASTSPQTQPWRSGSKVLNENSEWLELPPVQPLDSTLVICTVLFASINHLQWPSSRVLALDVILELSKYADDLVCCPNHLIACKSIFKLFFEIIFSKHRGKENQTTENGSFVDAGSSTANGSVHSCPHQ